MSCPMMQWRPGKNKHLTQRREDAKETKGRSTGPPEQEILLVIAG